MSLNGGLFLGQSVDECCVELLFIVNQLFFASAQLSKPRFELVRLDILRLTLSPNLIHLGGECLFSLREFFSLSLNLL